MFYINSCSRAFYLEWTLSLLQWVDPTFYKLIGVGAKFENLLNGGDLYPVYNGCGMEFVSMLPISCNVSFYLWFFIVVLNEVEALLASHVFALLPIIWCWCIYVYRMFLMAVNSFDLLFVNKFIKFYLSIN